MPIHDWSRVDAGTFHHFHRAWTIEIARALNNGLLPASHYALAEQVSNHGQSWWMNLVSNRRYSQPDLSTLSHGRTPRPSRGQTIDLPAWVGQHHLSIQA